VPRRVLFVLAAAFGAFFAILQATAEIELPQGPHRDLVYGKCRTCHDLQYLEESAGITPDDWDAMLDSMRQYGLRLTPEERADILDYLVTYLGPNPPKENAVVSTEPQQAVDGAAVFQEQCVSCHQPNGQGVAGQFPPLAGNTDLFADQDLPIYVVLFGLEGEIEVAGRTFDGAMPPFDYLSDASIAAVVNHVRTAWNNEALRPAGITDTDAAAVKAARGKELTADEVLAYRADRTLP